MPTCSDLSSPPPHHPMPAPARLHPVKSTRQRPRFNCSPAWLAPPHRRFLYSRHLPELLHAPAVLLPRPRSGQADAPPPLCTGRPPRPGPTAARHGRLLHAAASSAVGATPSSSTPWPSCRPGLGPVTPTRRHLYASAVLHAQVQLQPGVAGSSTPRPPLQLMPPQAPPRPGPVKPTRRRFYASAILHAPVYATLVSGMPWLLHVAA
jgi:hypothetical protein